jgi:hypothetical protein
MPISNWVNNLVQEPVNFAPLPPLSPAEPTGPLPTRKERAENNLAQWCASWTVLLLKLDETYAQYQHDSHGQLPNLHLCLLLSHTVLWYSILRER